MSRQFREEIAAYISERNGGEEFDPDNIKTRGHALMIKDEDYRSDWERDDFLRFFKLKETGLDDTIWRVWHRGGIKNPELMALIEEHHLTSKMISYMLDVPFETVRNWRRNETSSATKMSKANLKLLKLSLAK